VKHVVPLPFTRLFGTNNRRAIESVVPRRTFNDVILPPATRRALDIAMAQVTQHDLIFNRWGLGERHPTGLALAFNFAGPPGTGKTIYAEAIAHSLGRRLLLVRYAELESLWMGETPKNVAAIFRTARDERAVLLFDEADAIAMRRSVSVDYGFQRESNTTVSVLLQELEWYNGVVIFATNLAANFDPGSRGASAHTSSSRCHGRPNACRFGACSCTHHGRRLLPTSISRPWHGATR